MIHIRHLEFGWDPGATLLAIEEFRVERGERVFLRGPSGSGKSTLLGLIGGVLEARRGSVQVNGSELTGRSRAWRDRFRADHIGYIFQMFNLVPYLSVLDNVLLPAGFSKMRASRAGNGQAAHRAEASRLLAALDMQESLRGARTVVELSQGQQQRVAVARALFGRPELIIADEPTSSLDADARGRFLDLLMTECRQAGTTLLFVSHDLALSTRFDRTVEIKDVSPASPATRSAA